MRIMNRSTTTCARCFIPTCKNTTTNSSHKLFVLVKETLKKKWCEEVNVEYKPGRRLFCCEDHLNLEEDLENYQYYKLMKGRPILKATAKLRRTQDLPSCSKEETKTIAEASPSLKSLLLNQIENLQMIHTLEIKGHTENYFTNIRPTKTSASTHPMKMDAATQCYVKMMDQSTSTRGLLQTTKPLLASSTSSSCEICESCGKSKGAHRKSY